MVKTFVPLLSGHTTYLPAASTFMLHTSSNLTEAADSFNTLATIEEYMMLHSRR
jgi:hypothetical protein